MKKQLKQIYVHEFNPSQKQIKMKMMIIMIRKQNEKENC